ncbi:helix-turn-helix transcriptional regulator [Streptomyces luteolifulvus]|uniref:Helix-turn-helix transcriptional regulator n=1 Tax=Streptomyces luteolifulvus TaxID=2615112 RepID=A0A6H9V3M5_9ACTN|nr:helix-turn-helix transcriptional regulator [Streptomyces luteolifulvus]KAB1146797.1 helix-turn-helix transcriptional regulator [Streptomyces luteolifulvus]
MAGRLSDITGQLLLQWAAFLHRTVAGRDARQRNIDRRDGAVRAAYRRGVTVEQLAARMRLTPSWIRQVLNGKRPPEVEEAA